jgi:hypothetical protein
MMLLALRPEFRKLRFQMIADSVDSLAPPTEIKRLLHCDCVAGLERPDDSRVPFNCRSASNQSTSGHPTGQPRANQRSYASFSITPTSQVSSGAGFS